jgi:gamma-glutamylcysteine synthetase
VFSLFGGLDEMWKMMLGGTAIVSAIVAIAAQDVIDDILAGMMISLYKPFEIGNRIELEDGTAVFEEFANAEEMHAICTATTQHVLVCQQAGWARKDAIDWSAYKALYPEPANEEQPAAE